MAGGVDQIENIVLAVLCMIIQGDGVSLNGNAALPLQIHIVKQLILHIPQRHRLGLLQNPVSQGAFAVVDMGHDAEIADVVLCNTQKESPVPFHFHNICTDYYTIPGAPL